MSKQVYYKVVSHSRKDRKDRRKYHSVVAQTNPHGYIRYYKNRWTRPKLTNSKLFIFKSLKTAKVFAKAMNHDFSPAKVFRCKAKNVTRWSNMSVCKLSDSFVRFWIKFHRKESLFTSPSAMRYLETYLSPYSTMLADEVKIYGEPIPFTN